MKIEKVKENFNINEHIYDKLYHKNEHIFHFISNNFNFCDSVRINYKGNNFNFLQNLHLSYSIWKNFLHTQNKIKKRFQ